MNLEPRGRRYEYAHNKLVFSLWGEVVVESADGKQAGLFSFDDLFLVLGEGLREGLPERLVRLNQGGDWQFFESDHSAVEIPVKRVLNEGDTRLSYDPQDNSVTLTMMLRPKGAVWRSPH